MNENTIKEEFLKLYYSTGDIFSFEYLEKQTEYFNIEKRKELESLLSILTCTNYLVIEYEQGSDFEKIYDLMEKYNIYDFYIDLKSELFKLLEITDKDHEKYGC